MTTAAYPQLFFRTITSTLAMIALSAGFAISSHAMYVAPYNAKQQAANNTGQLISPSVSQQLALQLAAYDQFIEQNKDSTEQAKQVDVASVYFNKGKLLSEAKRNKEAHAVFQQLIKQYSDFPPAQMQVAYAYLGRMLLESERGDTKQALKTADDLIQRAGTSQDQAIKETLAKTWLAKAAIYAAFKQYKPATASTQAVINRYGAETSGSFRTLLAQAYTDQIVFQAHSSGLKPALKTAEQAIAYVGDDPALAQYLAFAYFNKGVAYRQADKYQQAVAAYDELLARFGDSQQVVVKNLLASAYSNQAENLVKMEQYDQARMVVDAALAKFASSTDPALMEAIATLYNNKGFLLFAQAKQQWRADRAAATTKLQQAKENYEKALAYKNVPGMGYASLYENYAYTMWLLGEPQVAENYLRQSLRVGGKVAYEAALEDIAMYSIAEDAGFKDLLKRLWAEHTRKK